MKTGVNCIAIGWLVCWANGGFAGPGAPNLLGDWAKAVKIDAHTGNSQGAHTQYDNSDMGFAFTQQEGGRVTGTKIAKGQQEPVTCEIAGNHKTITCKDDNGVFQGELYGSEEIAGTYRSNSESSTISVLILRRKK